MTEAEVEIRSAMEQLQDRMPTLDAMRLGAELYTAPRLSYFTMMRPNENAFSRIVGDLLNNRGSHGQGPLFLNTFLESLGLTRVGWQPVSVEIESETDAKLRPDILITTDSHIVCIENKRGALEREHQLPAYSKHAQIKAGERSWKMVLLSDQEPVYGDQVEHVSYRASKGARSLEKILEGCLDRVKAEPVRSYVLQLISEIRKSDVEVNPSEDIYVNAVLELPEKYARAAAATVVAGGRLHRRALGQIAQYIRDRLDGGGEEFVVGPEPLSHRLSEKYSSWTIMPNRWATGGKCRISIQSQRGNFEDVIFGVAALRPGSPHGSEEDFCSKHDELRKACVVVPGGRSTDWWPWSAAVDLSLDGLMRLIVNCEGRFPDDVPELRQMVDRIEALTQVIDPVLQTP